MTPDHGLHAEAVELLAGLVRIEATEVEERDESVIARLRPALLLCAHGHPHFTAAGLDQAAVLATLGMYQHRQYTENGDSRLVDEAVRYLRNALELTPEDHPRRGGYETSLFSVLTDRFDLTGNIAELDEIIDKAHDDGTDPARLNTRGMALLRRYRVTRNRGDLDESIRALRLALTLDQDERFPVSWTRSHLGSAFRERFEAYGDEADLREAEVHCRKALALNPEDTGIESNLAGVLRRKFDQTGDVRFLDEAIEFLERTLAKTNTVLAQNNLGAALHHRFLATRDTADLLKAVGQWRCRGAGGRRGRRAPERGELLGVLGGT